MQVPCACKHDKTALYDAVLGSVTCFIMLSMVLWLCVVVTEGTLEKLQTHKGA